MKQSCLFVAPHLPVRRPPNKSAKHHVIHTPLAEEMVRWRLERQARAVLRQFRPDQPRGSQTRVLHAPLGRAPSACWCRGSSHPFRLQNSSFEKISPPLALLPSAVGSLIVLCVPILLLIWLARRHKKHCSERHFCKICSYGKIGEELPDHE